MARSRRRSRSRKVGWANKLVIGRIAAIAAVVVAGTGGVFYQLNGWGTSTGTVESPEGATAQKNGIQVGTIQDKSGVASRKPLLPDEAGFGSQSNSLLASNNQTPLPNNPLPAGNPASTPSTSPENIFAKSANSGQPSSGSALPSANSGSQGSGNPLVPSPNPLLAKSDPSTSPAPLPSSSFPDSPLPGTSSQGDQNVGMNGVGTNGVGMNSGTGVGDRLPPVHSNSSDAGSQDTSLAGTNSGLPAGNFGGLSPMGSTPGNSGSQNTGSPTETSLPQTNMGSQSGDNIASSGLPKMGSMGNSSLPSMNQNSNNPSNALTPNPSQSLPPSQFQQDSHLANNSLRNGMSTGSSLPANNTKLPDAPSFAGDSRNNSDNRDIGSGSPGFSPLPTPTGQNRMDNLQAGSSHQGGSGGVSPVNSGIQNELPTGSSGNGGSLGAGSLGTGGFGGGSTGSLANQNGSGLHQNLPTGSSNNSHLSPANLGTQSNLANRSGSGMGGSEFSNQNNQNRMLTSNQGDAGLSRGQSANLDPVAPSFQQRENNQFDPAGRRTQDPTIRAASYSAGSNGGIGNSAPPITRIARSVASNQPGAPAQNTPQSAALVLNKLAPRQIQINVPTKFVLSVRNIGQIGANSVVVRDRVPKGTTLLRTNPRATRVNGDMLEWDFASIAARDEVKIEMELLPKEAGEIGSVAEVSFAAVAGCKTKCTRPVLEITHTARPEVLLGEQLVMSITVRNTGDGPAKNVLISEILPLQFSHPSISGQGKRGIEAVIGTLMPNQSVTKQLAVRAQKVGMVTNRIQVTGDGKLRAQHALNIKVIAPNIAVAAGGPNRRFIKRSATHTFQITNNGTAAASGVHMRVALPPGLKYQSSSPAGAYDARQHVVYWRMNQLVSGGKQSVTVKTLPLQSGNQTLTFTAFADRNQPQTVKKNLLVEQLSELFFDIDDTENVIEVGSETNYVVRIQNQGKQFDSNVKVRILIPVGLNPGNIIAPVRYQSQRDPQTGGTIIVFEDIARLNPGAEGQRIEIRAKGTRQGDHQVKVQVSSSRWPTWVTKEHTTKVYEDGT